MKSKSILILGVFLFFTTQINSLFCQNNFDLPSVTSTEKSAVTLDQFNVNVSVVGSFAITTYDMTFKNSSSRVLEGQLNLPMQEGESVIGYQLEVNGKMRKGVVVEKEEARQIFEEIVNRRVDPGIIEKTQGNNYRTRLYPIPANGYKRVIITTQQNLVSENNFYKYIFPFTSNIEIPTFSLTVDIYNKNLHSNLDNGNLKEFNFLKKGKLFSGIFNRKKYKISQPISLLFPINNTDEMIFFESNESERFFFSKQTVKMDVDVSKNKKEFIPDEICIYWDISLSGIERDTAKEIEFVRQVTLLYPDKNIIIQPFNSKLNTPKTFISKETDQILQYLRSLTYDGATNITILTDHQMSNRNLHLLFSDGICSLGETLYDSLYIENFFSIVTGKSNDFGKLNLISENQILNLNRISITSALDRIRWVPLKIISIEVTSGKVKNLNIKVGKIMSPDFNVCGKIESDEAEIIYTLGYQNVPIFTNKIVLRYDTINDLGLLKNDVSSLISRYWAQEQINKLTIKLPKSKDKIINYAKKYGIVTDFTSLIVLETMADYIRYKVEPPEELKDEYYRYLSQFGKSNQNFNVQIVQNDEQAVYQRIKNDYYTLYIPIISWRNLVKKTDFAENTISNTNLNPNDSLPLFEFRQPNNPTFDTISFAESISVDAAGNSNHRGNRGDGQVLIIDGVRVIGGTSITSDEITRTPGGISNAFNVSEGVSVTNENQTYTWYSNGTSASTSSPTSPTNKVSFKAYNSSQAYMIYFKNDVSKSNLYSNYLKIRKEYMNSPSFFVDVADAFYLRGMKDTAKLILSNIVEISNENNQLVQIYGNKLVEYEMYKEAVKVFKYNTILREEFPQSFRDLALAYEWAGDYQEAFDIMNFIISKDWGRFNLVKAIVFVDLNGILALHGDKIDQTNLYPSLKSEIPVKLRIVISWDTDNCDIDLHVKEPDGTICIFNNKYTLNGGKLSFDFTGGFGPEEYMMKNNFEGTYSIYAHYYGTRSQSQLMPVTVYADIYTDFGSPNQQHKRMLLRLKDKSDKYLIGEIKINDGLNDDIEEDDDDY